MNFFMHEKGEFITKKSEILGQNRTTQKTAFFSHYSGAPLSQFAPMAINPCSFDPWVPPGAPNHTKLVPFMPVTTSIFPWQ